MVLSYRGGEEMSQSLAADIEKVRHQFPFLRQKVNGRQRVYFDNAASTQKPDPVLDSIMRFYSTGYSNVHRGVHDLSERASEAYEGARKKVRSFINAASDKEIIFTRGTTESINLAAFSFGEAFLKKGDQVLVTEMEHHSNMLPWQMLCRRKGAQLRFVPFLDAGMLDMEAFEALLNDRTRLLAVTYVSNALGTINPVKQMIRKAHQHGVTVLVDAAQAVQHFKVDVGDLDCDMLAFSGHKMYAGTGIGALYVKEGLLDRMPPYQTGGGMVNSVSRDRTVFTDPPLKFEAGTGNIAGAVSLDSAIEFLRTLGMDMVEEHEKGLMGLLERELEQIPGIDIYASEARKSGVLSFNLKGVHPYDAGVVLNGCGIAVRTGTHCAGPVMCHYGVSGSIRVSFGIYNTAEEIKAFIEALKKAKDMLTL
jgi:cysteine desulfurase/selenocysteine lyase